MVEKTTFEARRAQMEARLLALAVEWGGANAVPFPEQQVRVRFEVLSEAHTSVLSELDTSRIERVMAMLEPDSIRKGVLRLLLMGGNQPIRFDKNRLAVLRQTQKLIKRLPNLFLAVNRVKREGGRTEVFEVQIRKWVVRGWKPDD
ncbi:MAG: hypothetical protein HYS26_03915 [Candidatus Kaiserbacteria bacterium]|nr:MAG: hypothetical protein HYS26_03915 [Candidatus Kaiserbacteria bacterium]